MTEVLIQMLGLIGWANSVRSYWRKTKKKILWSQIQGDIFYILHYFFLGATAGVATMAVCLLREIGFYLCKNHKQEKLLFYILVPIYLIVGALVSNTLVDALPIVACIIYCYTQTMAMSWMIVGCIIDAGYWLCYDLFCGSYVGIIVDFIIILSNIFALITKKKSKENV